MTESELLKTNREPLSVAIVGSGCIGSLIRFLLSDENTLVIRRNNFDDIEFEQVNGNTEPLKGVSTHVEAVNWSGLELLVVPVKSYQNSYLIEQLAPCVKAHTSILILQNGIASIEQYSEAFPNNRLFFGSITDGLYKSSENHVVHAGKGRLTIGELKSATVDSNTESRPRVPSDIIPRAIKKLLSHHSKGQWTENILPVLLHKLAVNVCINPLTFIHQIDNGRVSDYQDDLEQIIGQLVPVLNAWMKSDANTSQQRTSNPKRRFSRDELMTSVMDVIHQTANNRSSMLQDRLQATQTEIDAILLPVIKKAELHQLQVPLLKSLYDQVKAIESDYLSTSSTD